MLRMQWKITPVQEQDGAGRAQKKIWEGSKARGGRSTVGTPRLLDGGGCRGGSML